MKRLFMTALLGVICIVAVQAQTEWELQNMYSDMLKNEGISGYLDSDGDVAFTHENRTYFIIISEDDPQFFRIILPNIWEIETEPERIKVLNAADKVSAKNKVVKVYTVNDNVWVSFEMFVPQPGDAQQFLTRSLQIIKDSTIQFAEEMRAGN